jgi:hypothetical protein
MSAFDIDIERLLLVVSRRQVTKRGRSMLKTSGMPLE